MSQVDIQVVPPSDPLLANLPSGRDVFDVEPYVTPKLEEDVLSRMRAPPDLIQHDGANDSDSNDESEARIDPVGAFPGTKDGYTQRSTYY